MITFYTAVGRYVLRRDGNGLQYPAVINNEQELVLDIQEMIIWSSLLWQIRTYDELKADYRRQAVAAHICQEVPFDSYLNRLEQRGLIVYGRDYVGIDAIYDLISRLYVIPITDSLLAKIGAFLSLTWQGVPFRVTRLIFKKADLTDSESRVLTIARQQMMSTAEIVKCVQLDVADVSTEDKLVQALYSDEGSSSDNVHISSRFSPKQKPVLQAVANLYLKKQVMFEKAV